MYSTVLLVHTQGSNYACRYEYEYGTVDVDAGEGGGGGVWDRWSKG